MSNAMRKLQTKIGGVGADGAFGPNTARAIAQHYGLSPERGAHLLGQASHESGGFRLTQENLNYSVESMMRVWPSRFPTEESAEPYARNPKALADKVYSGRMGNKINEGHKFIGRGFLQLTGYENHRAFASDMGLPQILQDPSLLEEEYAFETAQWFFQKNNLFKIADEGVNDDTIKRITRRVNGGYHGLEDRTDQTNKIHSWLMDA
jgi:putative chitinase|tara:strand:- start:825 stop:1445 length:621 start_codon:yes stop_codon:yes gene_type:complete